MNILSEIDWVHIGYALGLFVLGIVIAKRLSLLTGRAVSRRFSQHQAIISRRLVFYGLLLIFTISALQQLGFKMTAILGAAGVFTVALSFASQTAASNLISGIFLLFERPFKVGDSIKIKDLRGTVNSIDLLSTHITTADNTLIRIPNETLMKSEITNMSYFPTRRIDIVVSVAYDTNIEHAKSVLLNLANARKEALKSPASEVIIERFGDWAIDLKLMVWTQITHATSLKNQLLEEIKQSFEQERIEMPSPQLARQKG